jgi:hypothetical protein
MYLPFGSYRMDCYAVIDYIRTIHKGKEAPRIGLLTYNNAYGRSIHQPTRDYAARQKVQIVAIEEFPPKTVDLTTELLRLCPPPSSQHSKVPTGSVTHRNSLEPGPRRTRISSSSAKA